MRPEPSRRSVLTASTAALGASLAGCSGGSNGKETSTQKPDAGRDSYGIHLFSKAESTQTVNLKVTYSWADGNVFEKTLEVDSGFDRTWQGVITEEREHKVVAKIEEGEGQLKSAGVWVTPGEEDAPTDANVQVKVQTAETASGPQPVVAVYFESLQKDS